MGGDGAETTRGVSTNGRGPEGGVAWKIGRGQPGAWRWRKRRVQERQEWGGDGARAGTGGRHRP